MTSDDLSFITVLDLFVAINSTCEVRVGGAVASYLPPFQLIGEASLLENLQSPGGEAHPPARATVVAAPGSRYVRWPQSAFYELQEEEDTDFAYAIQLMIARTLSQKLSAARNSQTVAEERLTERKRAVLRGVSPATLAAQRVGDSTLEGGAAAEVTVLHKQNQASACTCSRWRPLPSPHRWVRYSSRIRRRRRKCARSSALWPRRRGT